jgi:hypothetical protein
MKQIKLKTTAGKYIFIPESKIDFIEDNRIHHTNGDVFEVEKDENFKLFTEPKKEPGITDIVLKIITYGVNMFLAEEMGIDLNNEAQKTDVENHIYKGKIPEA